MAIPFIQFCKPFGINKRFDFQFRGSLMIPYHISTHKRNILCTICTFRNISRFTRIIPKGNTTKYASAFLFHDLIILRDMWNVKHSLIISDSWKYKMDLEGNRDLPNPFCWGEVFLFKRPKLPPFPKFRRFPLQVGQPHPRWFPQPAP